MMAVETAARPGKRARMVKERNDVIRKAAMALARRHKWPSPPAIAEKTGISRSVVEREIALLLDARREWEKVTGQQHPQWRDPKASGQGDPPPAGEKEAQHAAAQSQAAADQIKRYKAKVRKQSDDIASLKEKVVDLEEQVRRLLLRVRPPELNLILEAGALQRRKGKAKKRSRIRP